MHLAAIKIVRIKSSIKNRFNSKLCNKPTKLTSKRIKVGFKQHAPKILMKVRTQQF